MRRIYIGTINKALLDAMLTTGSYMMQCGF